jgi:hypothetical protein
MTDKLRALDMLGRYLKLFAEDRNPVDLGVKVIILDAPRPVRIGFSNAGALPVRLCRQWFEDWPEVKLMNTYGKTERKEKIYTKEQKKREFNMITDELYSLIRTVRYDGSTVYHMRCPNAFADSSEAYWLSPVNKILNPYLGNNHPSNTDKAHDQGEISDSLHFSAPVSE